MPYIHPIPDAPVAPSMLPSLCLKKKTQGCSIRLVNYPPPKGGWASCLAIITESCLGAIGLHFGIGPCSGEACSRHSARLWVLVQTA